MLGDCGFRSGSSGPESDNQNDNRFYHRLALICSPLQFSLVMEVEGLQRFAATRSPLQQWRRKTGGQVVAGSNPAAPTS
jgi:hypothetical protein